jgi:hypothetical protein
MRFGARAAGVPIAISQQCEETGQGVGGATNPNPPRAPVPWIGVPVEALKLNANISTGDDGLAVLKAFVSDPANPRGYLDGQIYKINYSIVIGGSSPPHLFDQVVLHVRDAFAPPAAADWTRDVAPILVQYGDLYPVMSKGLFSLSDLRSSQRTRESSSSRSNARSMILTTCP